MLKGNFRKMKKFLSLLCALALVLSLGTVCFAAAATETATLDYTMIDEDLEGSWVTFGLDDTNLFQLFIPDGFDDMELTDEDYDDGYLWGFSDEEDGRVLLISGTLLEDYGVTDYEDLATVLYLGGFTDIENFVTNGIHALFTTFTTEDNLTYCAVWVSYGDDAAICFSFYPCETEEDQALVMNILASLCPPDEE